MPSDILILFIDFMAVVNLNIMSEKAKTKSKTTGCKQLSSSSFHVECGTLVVGVHVVSVVEYLV